MKIAFFTEGGYVGKIHRNHPNMRTDVAWVCALDAVHHPITTIHTIPTDTYDLGIIIVPKNKERIFDYPLIESAKKACKKICTMQESTYWYWQGGSIESQLWYHALLQEMDFILCHNDHDLQYYRGITDVNCYLMPSLMIEDSLGGLPQMGGAPERSGVMVGGNWVTAYRGIDSYLVGKIMSDNITSPTTGRMKPEETQLDIKHLPWMQWTQWIHELSRVKYGVQLGTAAAGTFNLNCAYLGIPCIGYDNVNTQIHLHPNLSVTDGDIVSARRLATQLKDDKDFYNECSIDAKINYNKYREENYVKHMDNIFINEGIV